jgi:hypothetical protein
MKRYQPSPFRPAFGIAAASLSAVTLAVAVILPMSFASACPAESTLARAPHPTAVIASAYADTVAAPMRTVTLEPIHVVARRGSQPS